MSLWWNAVPLLYFVSQNNYFGWNGKAQSDAEIIADGIVLIMFILVGILININNKE